MALHFSKGEFTNRLEQLKTRMLDNNLDCMLLFAQESMFWLTGYDTFGYCFFQCLVVKANGEMVLLTRSADLRQARHTSTIDNIVIWTDRGNADPTNDLHNLLSELDLVGSRIGVEYDTTGLTAKNGMAVNERLKSFAELEDASEIVNSLRVVKSEAELEYVRKAGQLSDEALDAAIAKTKAGADEGDILAAMHSVIFSAGGDYAGNEFIIGSGSDALLCRYKSGRRKLSDNDQLTLEWSGAWAHYHAGHDAHFNCWHAFKQTHRTSCSIKRRHHSRKRGDESWKYICRYVRCPCCYSGSGRTFTPSPECLWIIPWEPPTLHAGWINQ